MSNALVRVFPNDERIRYRNSIHEFAALDGNETGMPAIVSPIEIIHLGYRDDVMLERKKYERNMEIAEAGAACRARRSVQLVQLRHVGDAGEIVRRMQYRRSNACMSWRLQRQRERGERARSRASFRTACVCLPAFISKIPRP